jgi:aspartate racemase
MEAQAINKRSLGIIGGMGPHAGAWLLRRILDLSGLRKDQDYPEIVLHNNSRISDRTRAILYNGESPLSEMKRTISLFNSFQIDIAMLACMTAHFYHSELSSLFNGRLLNVIDITVDELLTNDGLHGKRKIGLIGSTGLLKSGLFQDRLQSHGYHVLTLNDADQENYFMKPIYMEGGIKSGVFKGRPKRLFVKQVDILLERGAEVVIGACSEVPLVMDQEFPVPFVDSFDLLAVRTVQIYYNK